MYPMTRQFWRQYHRFVSCRCYQLLVSPSLTSLWKEPWAFTGIWNMTISNFASLLKTSQHTVGVNYLRWPRFSSLRVSCTILAQMKACSSRNVPKWHGLDDPLPDGLQPGSQRERFITSQMRAVVCRGVSVRAFSKQL